MMFENVNMDHVMTFHDELLGSARAVSRVQEMDWLSRYSPRSSESMLSSMRLFSYSSFCRSESTSCARIDTSAPPPVGPGRLREQVVDHGKGVLEEGVDLFAPVEQLFDLVFRGRVVR